MWNGCKVLHWCIMLNLYFNAGAVKFRVFLHTEYQVVINLHHEGVVISSRETKGGSCAVWNTSFLFDLPPGEISQLRVVLEFIIVQVTTQSFPESRSEKVWANICDALTLRLISLCGRVGPFPKAKFSVGSGSVRRLRTLDELTGGMCVTCRWSRRAGTPCSRSPYRAATQWTRWAVWTQRASRVRLCHESDQTFSRKNLYDGLI